MINRPRKFMLLKMTNMALKICFYIPKTAKCDRRTKIWSKNSEKLFKNDKFWSHIYFNVPKPAKYD